MIRYQLSPNCYLESTAEIVPVGSDVNDWCKTVDIELQRSCRIDGMTIRVYKTVSARGQTVWRALVTGNGRTGIAYSSGGKIVVCDARLTGVVRRKIAMTTDEARAAALRVAPGARVIAVGGEVDYNGRIGRRVRIVDASGVKWIKVSR